MVKYKEIIFAFLILFFLSFSFFPTIFEISRAGKLADPNREFILEHNYYWPDFNLYLSKVRQGYEGHLTAVERYTSEPHAGSLIQEFYVILGRLGRILNLDPNSSYQLGRLILSPLLLIIILLLVRYYFVSFNWQILAFIITLVSGSFPRFYNDPQGALQIGRYMEWWSNIDSLQRITFIPHILFGQVISFYLLYRLTMKQLNNETMKQLFFFILLGNAVGLTFPPSLITLNGVLVLILLIRILTELKQSLILQAGDTSPSASLRVNERPAPSISRGRTRKLILFIILTLSSLLYFLILTKQFPWSALVEFHRTHPMMVPFDQYILGTGPIFFLGIAGAIVSIIKRERRFQPLILWIIVTLSFAALFSTVKEQSPLRFTQTGLFIPLGILGTYFFQQLWLLVKSIKYPFGPSSGRGQILSIKYFFVSCYLLFVICYLLLNLFIMKLSLNWQTTWISQRVGASIPAVPYPPQTMYPIKAWMDGIRWLKDNTSRDDVVLAEITAGNYIPAYSGNTVYFGQANTVNYNRKQLEVDNFFSGQMTHQRANIFLRTGRIKYIFFSVQEKEKARGKDLTTFYPFLKPIFSNSLVIIYK